MNLAENQGRDYLDRCASFEFSSLLDRFPFFYLQFRRAIDY